MASPEEWRRAGGQAGLGLGLLRAALGTVLYGLLHALRSLTNTAWKPQTRYNTLERYLRSR